MTSTSKLRLALPLFASLLAACASAADPDSAGGEAPVDEPGATEDAGARGPGGSTPGNGGNGGSGGSGGAGGGATSPDAGGAGAGGAGNGGAAGAGGAAGGGAGGGATPGAAYPAFLEGGDIAAGIAHLNAYRATLGLSQVTLDAATSTGCEGHLDYLIWEAQNTGQNVLRHDEPNHANPHYSPANEQAGKDSDIAWGQDQNGGQTLGAAVDVWINGLYHRHPLLDPGLVRVGAASKQGYNCLNYRSNGNTQAVVATAPVLWPADGMTDVPRTFIGNEGPCPTTPNDPLNGGSQHCPAGGFIPTAVFYGWGDWQTSAFQSVSSVKLLDTRSNAEVPLLAWYGDGVSGHDPAHGYVLDEIALVPQASLGANVTYQVAIDAVVRSAPTELRWTFTTGTRDR